MTDSASDLADDELTALLERDYRRLLRWYPKAWRDAHGDALLGVLLDDADDGDRFTVQRGEWRAFVAAGLRARLDRIVLRRVRDAAATVMLSMGAGASVATFLLDSAAPWKADAPDLTPSFGPFYDAAPILTVLWVVALLAAYGKRWWVGRVALALSVVVSVGMHRVEALIAPPQFFSLDYGTLAFSAACAVVAVLGRPRTGLPLLGASAGFALLLSLGYVVWPLSLGSSGGDRSPASPMGILYWVPALPVSSVLVALGVAVLLAVRARWVPAFAILLAVLPLTAAIDALNVFFIVDGWSMDFSPEADLLITVPVVLGLATLVLASQGRLRMRAARGVHHVEPTARV